MNRLLHHLLALALLFAGIAPAQLTPGTPAATAALAPETGATFVAEEAQSMHARLWKWRKKFETDSVGDVGVFGDSMIANTSVQAEMQPAFAKAFGLAGYCFIEPFESGGATKYSGGTGNAPIFTHWFNGTIVRLSASGHTATVNLGSTTPVEANTLKLFYVKKSGGGVFKIQTRMNGGTWTDEASYLTVDTNAATDGGIITITKTNLRALWDIRAVWVSGGQVDVIGGALYDTRLKGIRYGLFGVGSTELNQSITASSTVTNTIMGNIGVDLALLSHLDGAAEVPTSQATFQGQIDTASGTAPNWVTIGPPVGQTTNEDALRKAQAVAMKTLADTRRDAFYDNRRWAGTTAQAIAAGLLLDASDPHYQNLAAAAWVPKMIQELGLAETRATNAGSAASLSLLGAGTIRQDEIVNSSNPYHTTILGDLSVGPAPGLNPAGVGYIKLYDIQGPSNSNDWGGPVYDTDNLKLLTGGTARWQIWQGNGAGSLFWDPQSSAGAPLGLIGASTAPILELHVGKTITAGGTTGAQTINKTSGRVNFAAGSASLVVTCSRVTANSVIIATVATNDSTMKAVQAVAGAGSFTLYPNANPTAETAVNWWFVP